MNKILIVAMIVATMLVALATPANAGPFSKLREKLKGRITTKAATCTGPNCKG